MKYFIGAISFLLILIVGFLIFIYSGLYNMGTAFHHNRLTLWAINTMVDNSIKHHAKDPNIKPPDLKDTSLVRSGFIHYNRMCIGCHGAPGIEQRAKGFYPNPPKIVRAAEEWSPAELFWVIKYGLKMSAMPSFASILPDNKIWEIVAFMQKLPNLSNEQYQMLVNENKGENIK
jgi:mono/diheme cytochrome c family protein